MKYVVKYRKKGGGRHFYNVVEPYVITRGARAGVTDIRDRLFNTMEEAEEVRNALAKVCGDANVKIVARNA